MMPVAGHLTRELEHFELRRNPLHTNLLDTDTTASESYDPPTKHARPQPRDQNALCVRLIDHRVTGLSPEPDHLTALELLPHPQ